MNIKKINILLADDDEDDRGFFEEAISKIDNAYKLVMVDNGEKAINLIKDAVDVPDYIFLDINMPVRSGLECLAFIKGHDLLKHIPVVMLSTSRSEDDINFSYKHGASAYIQKPDSFNKLLRYIDYTIHHQKQLSRKDFLLNENSEVLVS